ncbi:MAG: hypothetical protein JWM34_5040 [Ilumatobacteraceae bacterium]|nr:hypothetical protein [Ilumatobacteraceae bacterium]
MTFLLALVVLVVIIAAGVTFGAMRNKAAFQKQGQIVPGTASRAPAAWAGAHTPEALLHRRLRAAVDAARAQAAVPGSGFGDLQQTVERGAVEIDDRLIAAAALPEANRAAAIAAIEPSVVALENAVSGTAAPSAAPTPELGTAAADVQNRLDAIAEARAEVDQLDTTRTAPMPPPAVPQTQPQTNPPQPPPTA